MPTLIVGHAVTSMNPHKPASWLSVLPKAGELLMRHRRSMVVAFHVVLVMLSSYLALWLRFDGDIPELEYALWRNTVVWLVLIRVSLFARFRLYMGLWRYTGIWDLRNIATAIGLSSLIFFVLVRWILDLSRYPRSVFIIDALMLMFLMGGSRLTKRVYRELIRPKGRRSVLIFGAGDAGEMIVRDMKNNPVRDYDPIGFVDDDVNKAGCQIHGVPVLGTRADLVTIVMERNPQEVLIAAPTAEAATIRHVVRMLEPFKVHITTLPSLRELPDGSVSVSSIRRLAVEDLLSRPPIGLDPKPLRAMIEGRRVLVTGAGGSIGSELSRQIARLRPGSLTLYERYENGLYTVINALEDDGHSSAIQGIVGDVCDEARLNDAMARCLPDIVFHAAAHKHVPLMEGNPCEAVKNNVTGTRLVAEAAERHGVDRVVLISTDKAVNPTSVMGVTKRVAELLFQTRKNCGALSLCAVRFGNVLGSNGSAVPRFMQQIRAGGPVTITHPEMRRFFMLIPEAVQLVVHAAARAESGAIYVLEMGEQIHVLDIARDLIRLSGYVPEEEIAITFIGLRPGEKLYEEVVGPNEVASSSGVDKVLRVTPLEQPDPKTFSADLSELERLAQGNDAEGVLRQLSKMVPEYRRQCQVTAELEMLPMAPAGARQ